MRAQLTYWKYLVSVEPHISFSERFHYFLRGHISPQGTVHLGYTGNEVIVTTLSIVPSGKDYTEEYAGYRGYIHNELAKANISHDPIRIVSSCEWEFDIEEGEIGEFLLSVEKETQLISMKIQSVLKTLQRVNPVCTII